MIIYRKFTKQNYSQRDQQKVNGLFIISNIIIKEFVSLVSLSNYTKL